MALPDVPVAPLIPDVPDVADVEDVPDVPVGIGEFVGSGAAVVGAAPAGDGLVADVPAGFEGFAVDEGFEAGGIAPAFEALDPLVPPATPLAPPAACSNSFRCVRKSWSFALMAGSICMAGPAAPAAPDVPVVADPAPVVPVVPVVPVALAAAPDSGPIRLSRVAETFA